MQAPDFHRLMEQCRLQLRLQQDQDRRDIPFQEYLIVVIAQL